MPKYLLLKHYRGGPEPHRAVPPMVQWAAPRCLAWQFGRPRPAAACARKRERRDRAPADASGSSNEATVGTLGLLPSDAGGGRLEEARASRFVDGLHDALWVSGLALLAGTVVAALLLWPGARRAAG
jgi:hypothetical protein